LGAALSYVDTHLHLADHGYAGRTEEAIADADKNHVEYLLSNAVDYETATKTIALARQHPSKVLAAVGVHPWTVTNTTNYYLEKFEQLIDENAGCVSAIGEIGLDGKYCKDEKIKERQLEVFRFFLKLAERKGLPAVVHSRLAVDEVLETLPDFHISKVLLHWYDGPVSKFRVIKERGYLVSIGPAALYSQAISEIARNADLDMILSETDGPVKYRGPFEGRPTEPSFVVDVIRKVAEIKNLDTEAVREAAWRNFETLIPHLSERGQLH
jgi:TatD DNase family protein